MGVTCVFCYRMPNFQKLTIASASLIIESMPFHYLLVRHSHKAMYLVLYVWLILSALLSKAYQYAKSFHRCIHKNDIFQMFMNCFIIFLDQHF